MTSRWEKSEQTSSEYKDDPREHSQEHTWGWSAGCWVRLSSAPVLTHSSPSCQHRQSLFQSSSTSVSTWATKHLQSTAIPCSPFPTQVLLGFPFFPLLSALGQEHNLPFQIRVMWRFLVKVTRSYRWLWCRGSYKSIPTFPCCCLRRKLVVFFSLVQTQAGNEPGFCKQCFSRG